MSRIPEAQEMKGSGKSSSFLLPLFIIRLKNCQNLFSCPRVSCAPVFGCVGGTWHGGRAEMLGTDTQIQQTRMRRGSAKTGACQWFRAREEACGPGETDCAQEPGLGPGEETRSLEMLAGGGAP